MQEMAAEGRTVEIFPADASDAAQMESLARFAREKFGPVQGLVYATGTNIPDRAMRRLRPELWNEMMATNLSGAYYATHAVLPEMRERRFGHLIYVASISGHTPDVSGAAYQASKRGMIGLAHAVRLEEKENGIRTTVVNPGLVDTELLDQRPVRPSAELLAQAMTPEHVAEAVMACAKLPPHAVISDLTVLPAAL